MLFLPPSCEVWDSRFSALVEGLEEMQDIKDGKGARYD